MSKETVTLTTHLPYLRPGDLTCKIGTIKFNADGEAEVSKEDADEMRGQLYGVSFSDEETEEKEAPVEEVKEKVLEVDSMPKDLLPPEPEEKTEEPEEVKEEKTPPEDLKDDKPAEKNSPAADLDALSIEDLQELCSLADLPAEQYGDLEKGELIIFMVENNLA